MTPWTTSVRLTSCDLTRPFLYQLQRERISRRRKLDMSIRKYKAEQIVTVLRQIEVQIANGGRHALD